MSNQSLIRATLSVYVFTENGVYIAYCPELDISASGNDDEDAREALTETLAIYFDDTISRGTLEEDLILHGWRRKGDTVQEPTTNEMLRKTSLKDIISKSEFHKYSMPVPVS